MTPSCAINTQFFQADCLAKANQTAGGPANRRGLATFEVANSGGCFILGSTYNPTDTHATAAAQAAENAKKL
jgi:hypothetical protein